MVSRDDAVLSAEVEGRLISIVDVGTRVETGDTIARIEDTGLQLRAEELAAEITRAEARPALSLKPSWSGFRRLAETNLAAASQIDQDSLRTRYRGQ